MKKIINEVISLLIFKNNNENNRFHEIANGLTLWLHIISVALVIFLIVR